MISARPGTPDDGSCQIGDCATRDDQVTVLGFGGENVTTVVRLCRGHLRKLSAVTAAVYGSFAGLGHHNRQKSLHCAALGAQLLLPRDLKGRD